jgi:uncharacterized protein (TIGR03437 family)
MRYLAILLLSGSVAFGYIRVLTQEANPVPLIRVDNTGIQFNLDQSVVAGAQSSLSKPNVTVITSNSDPFGATRAALAAWNSVTTSNIKFLALQTNSAGINPNDNIMTIAIATTNDELSIIPNGAIAATSDTYATGSGTLPNGWTVQDGSIIDSDIILHPGFTFSTTGAAGTFDLQAVLTHELGHALGSNHVGLLGATMFPYSNQTIQRNLSSDDMDLVNQTYPLPTGAPASGTISGTISTASGQPAPFALVTMIDQSGGNTYEALAGSNGAFSLAVPPASYVVYAEPFNSFVSGGNFYLTTTQAASAVAFQPAFLGTALNPTLATVTANATTPANLAVNPGTSSLASTRLFYGFGTTGKKGDVQSFSSVSGPILLASGQTIDFVFSGAGYDSTFSTSNVLVFGQGIHVTAVAPDASGETISGLPVLRATIKIDPRTNTSLASLIMTKGGNTTAFTGLFVLTPPTPTFSSQSVANAGSGADTAVSPGEIVQIYGSNLGPTGPAFGGNGTFFDPNGYLATNILGSTVTFDGVAAPLFYTGPGQINVVVPFEVAAKVGSSTQVVVTNNGSASAPVAVPVVARTPALFENPPGVAAATYLDYSAVTQSNPAARGTIIIVYGTGLGVPSYALKTGQVPPIPTPNFPGYTATVGGVPASVQFTGLFNNFVGLAQWYIQLPSSSQLSATGAVPIIITSPQGEVTKTVNIYVK